MYLKLNRILNGDLINKFIVLNIFLFFLSYVLSKGFLQNEELSDKIFLILCVLSVEISYLFFSNKLIKFNLLYDKNRSLQKKIKIEQLRKETS